MSPDLKMSEYKNYRGQNAGRLLHHLYIYCGVDVAENAIVGGKTINFRNDCLATYAWRGETDVAQFIFNKLHKSYYPGYDKKQDLFQNYLDDEMVLHSNCNYVLEELIHDDCPNLKNYLALLPSKEVLDHVVKVAAIWRRR